MRGGEACLGITMTVNPLPRRAGPRAEGVLDLGLGLPTVPDERAGSPAQRLVAAKAPRAEGAVDVGEQSAVDCCCAALEVEWELWPLAFIERRPDTAQGESETMAPTKPATAEPRPPFQFRLRTLLLLCVVLASSLAMFGAWGIVVFALAVGMAIFLRHVSSLWPSAIYAVLVSLFLIYLICYVLGPVARRAPKRVRCMYKLHQIVLALQAYEQTHGCLPPAYVADTNGKPMHSWRVLILPFLKEEALYNAYNLAEPWDGANNKKLSAKCPFIFQCPCDETADAAGAGRTSYVAVVGANAAWAGDRQTKLGDFGTKASASATVMLVELPNSDIAWTEPRDLTLASIEATGEGARSATLSRNHGGRTGFFLIDNSDPCVNAAMADASVGPLRLNDRSLQELRDVLQIGAISRALIGDPRHLNWRNIAALAVWLLSVGTLLAVVVRSRRPRTESPEPSAQQASTPPLVDAADRG
jgi:hypothetical protein